MVTAAESERGAGNAPMIRDVAPVRCCVFAASVAPPPPNTTAWPASHAPDASWTGSRSCPSAPDDQRRGLIVTIRPVVTSPVVRPPRTTTRLLASTATARDTGWDNRPTTRACSRVGGAGCVSDGETDDVGAGCEIGWRLALEHAEAASATASTP